jgi:membrane-associated protease RseP (regulator of RpoE activity)
VAFAGSVIRAARVRAADLTIVLRARRLHDFVAKGDPAMRLMTSGLVAITLAAMPMTAAAGPGDQNAQEQQEEQPQPQQQQAPQQVPQQTEEDTFEYESSSGPRLGIMVTGLTQELRSFYGVPDDRGVLVARVAPHSPAARAGIRVGDILVGVRSSTIANADDVLQVLSSMQRGEAFPLTIVRDHRAMTLQAKLPSKEHMHNQTKLADPDQRC